MHFSYLDRGKINHNSHSKGLFIASDSGNKSEKDQITNNKDQRINCKHEKNFFTFAYAFTACEWALYKKHFLCVPALILQNVKKYSNPKNVIELKRPNAFCFVFSENY